MSTEAFIAQLKYFAAGRFMLRVRRPRSDLVGWGMCLSPFGDTLRRLAIPVGVMRACHGLGEGRVVEQAIRFPHDPYAVWSRKN
jgi:hypothetical protein